MLHIVKAQWTEMFAITALQVLPFPQHLTHYVVLVPALIFCRRRSRSKRAHADKFGIALSDERCGFAPASETDHEGLRFTGSQSGSMSSLLSSFKILAIS